MKEDERLLIQDLLYDDYGFILDYGEIGAKSFMFRFRHTNPKLYCRINKLTNKYWLMVEETNFKESYDSYSELVKAIKIVLLEYYRGSRKRERKSRLLI